MENNNEIQKPNFRWPFLGALVDRYASPGIICSKLSYTADSWSVVMLHVELILLRGNAVRVKNVAGKYIVTELVVA